MPCQGPSEAEFRRGKERSKVYSAIIYLRRFGFFDEHIAAAAQAERRSALHAGMIPVPKHLWLDFDKATEMVCTAIRGMTTEQEDKILYNGRSKNARGLADWWEKHQKDDKAAGRI